MSDSEAASPDSSPSDGGNESESSPPPPDAQSAPPPSPSPPTPSSSPGSNSPPPPSPSSDSGTNPLPPPSPSPPPPSSSDSGSNPPLSPPPPTPSSSNSGSKPLHSPPPPIPSSDSARKPPPSPNGSDASPTSPPPLVEASPPPPKSSTPSPTIPAPSNPSNAPPTSSQPPPSLSSPPPPIPSSSSNDPLLLSPPVVSPSPPGSSTTSPSPPTISVTPSPPTANPSSSDSGSSSSSSRDTSNFSPPNHADSSSHSPKSPGGSSRSEVSGGPGVYVSMTVVGLVVVMVAIFFVVKRKRKNKMDLLATHYMTPNNLSGRSDGYYYGQGNSMGFSGSSGSYHASNPARPGPGTMYESHRGHGFGSGPPDSGGGSFSYEELMEVTNGFSRENLIGEGGFGCVYKGWLSDGKCVAVKQLKAGSGQGEREFRAEVEIISRVHHRHLVSLVGYCIAEYHRMLVYEFVKNNTLEHHLHEKGLPVLEWQNRMKIAIGSARGLAYLHEDCHPRIIHRDIKSANILLEESFEAQVADFGLAKLSNDTNTHVSTRIMGTFGYLAPEYASSGKLTDRSDVYSFGVVLLELITGRKPVDPTQPLGDESLVEWARPLLVDALETGDCEVVADARLQSNYVKHEMLRMIEVAAACVRHSAPKRPRMVQVVRALDNDGDMPDLSNGVKFGQSTVFNSGQYSADINRFRMMAFASGDLSSEYGYSSEQDHRSAPRSGEHRQSGESPQRPLNAANSGGGSGASEEYRRAGSANQGTGSQRQAGSYRYQGRGFP